MSTFTHYLSTLPPWLYLIIIIGVAVIVAAYLWHKTTIYFAILPIIIAVAICMQLGDPDHSYGVVIIWVYPPTVPALVGCMPSSSTFEDNPTLLAVLLLIGSISFALWVNLHFPSDNTSPLAVSGQCIIAMAIYAVAFYLILRVLLPRSNPSAAGWGRLGAIIDSIGQASFSVLHAFWEAPGDNFERKLHQIQQREPSEGNNTMDMQRLAADVPVAGSVSRLHHRLAEDSEEAI
ncbi:hypothetical protein FISHEDRAFT_70231 [Fistulina hepatica ATCC 64428]|uniref:Uncharacterized protein n=1 Tax=Fistulina hepatica ATCC 64428 TaxID=1128425 RepID=A0A0D7AJQ2_9AGAR|nr:hypothetical protein FISHEDRAFT_70231 [Fistulina hepatica ATCC 64428]